MSLNQRISPSLSENIQLQQVPVRKQAGFTLVEALIVVAIIGILGTFAVPSLQEWREHGSVNNATIALYVSLKGARSIAVAESRDVRVVFDEAADTFMVDDDNGGACANCKPELVNLSTFSNTLALTTSGGSTSTFTSRGTTGNKTMKLAVGTYYKCIVINQLGRSYIVGDLATAAVKASCLAL